MDIRMTAERLAQQGWRRHAPKGFTGLIGPLWSRTEQGVLAFGLIAGEDHLNPDGLVHGGMLATLLDQVISTAAWQAAERLPCVTIQLDTQFLSAVKAGAFVEARAEVVKKTREIVFARGELIVSMTIVATGNAVLKILQAATGH
jgi:uncharacterized protein (TIGR00369 family)